MQCITLPGRKIFLVDGKIHNEEDKPAIIWNNGTVEFWTHGKRIDSKIKPAIIYPSGSKMFYTNGKNQYFKQMNTNICCLFTKRYKSFYFKYIFSESEISCSPNQNQN